MLESHSFVSERWELVKSILCVFNSGGGVNNVLFEVPESPKAPLNVSSDKRAWEHEKYVDSEALTSSTFIIQSLTCIAVLAHIGQFVLNNATEFGLVAYATSKASSKVHSAVITLPRLFDVEILRKCVIWPKSLDMFPPNGVIVLVSIYCHSMKGAQRTKRRAFYDEEEAKRPASCNEE
ncbi:hypothetical protein Fmac_001265 [Flemingia macrophylla]|uniref:Uncharacterized protein n=1 Tax=Flemingia macrophylla TaxID=520843 RepID=A0ABD1NGK3_9FABA